MTTFRARILAMSIVCCILPSCMRLSVIAHNEKAAATSATQFAQTAFVDRDYSKLYGLLSPTFVKLIPNDKLLETIAKMHPKSFPAQITATDFEPMPGQRGMNIYLTGTTEGEDFYYRFEMEGDASSGYRVAGLFRGNGPNPSTNKRPLK